MNCGTPPITIALGVMLLLKTMPHLNMASGCSTHLSPTCSPTIITPFFRNGNADHQKHHGPHMSPPKIRQNSPIPSLSLHPLTKIQGAFGLMAICARSRNSSSRVKTTAKKMSKPGDISGVAISKTGWVSDVFSNFQTHSFSRMRSEGFPFIVWGSGGWTLVRLEWLVGSPSRRRRVGVASLIPCLWRKLQNLSFSKVSKQVVMPFCVASVALCDMPTCLITRRKCQNVSKLEEFSHEMLVLLRPRVSFRVSSFPVASPCLWGKLQNLPTCLITCQNVKIGGILARNARFAAPTCLVSSI